MNRFKLSSITLLLLASQVTAADELSTNGVQMSDDAKLLSTPLLKAELNHNLYVTSIADYSIVLAEALASANILASNAAQKAIDDNKPTRWKSYNSCKSTTSRYYHGENHYSSTYYNTTTTGSMTGSISNFTYSGRSGCNRTSISFY